MSGKGMATPGSRAPRARAVPRLLLAALGTGYTAGSLRGWGSDQLALVMGPFGLCAAAGAAAVSCFLHARSRHDQFRRVWMLFALASVMLALGHLARGWREVGPQSAVPGHAYVHGFILACAPLAIAALLVLAKRPVTKAGWACLVLDFWLIAASLLTSVWTLVRAQAAEPAGGSVPGFAYPLLGISLASTIVLLHSYRPAVNRTALNTAAGALAVTMVCQAPFLSPLLHDTSHRAGRLVDAGWFAGCLLLAYAPWSASGQRPPAGRRSQRPAVPGLSAAAPPYAAADWRQPAPQRTTGSLAALAPYLAAAVCTLGILYTVLSRGTVDRFTLLTAATVVFVLVVRQAIMLLDNISLAGELAQKESHFRSLVQGSSDVIMTIAPNGILRYVSPAAAGVYKRPPEDLVGTELAGLVHPQDLGRVVHEVRRFLAASPLDEPATRIECRFRSGDGGWLDVESTVNRHHSGLIFNSRDVSERVPLRDRLQPVAAPARAIPENGRAVDVRAEEERPRTADTTPQDKAPSPSDTDKAMSRSRGRRADARESGGRAVQFIARFLALLLPASERPGWLEEQRAILADLPGRVAQWQWMVAWLIAMPRVAYTFRSGRDKESV